MKRHSAILLIACLLLLAGCVYPENQGSTANAQSGGKVQRGGQYIVLEVGDRPVSVQELMRSPMLRAPLRQLLLFDTLQAEASKLGLTVDQEEVNHRIQEQKDAISGPEGIWEDWLREQSLTEEDIYEMTMANVLFDSVIDAQFDYTDEDARQVWEQDKDSVLDEHMRENHLPDSERARLTFEDVKETALDQLKRSARWEKQQEVMDLIHNNTEIKILCFDDPEEAQLYEDLIVNWTKPKNRKSPDEIQEMLEPESDTEEIAPADEAETEAEAETASPETEAGDDEVSTAEGDNAVEN